MICRIALALPDHCAPLWIRDFRELFTSVEAMLSADGLAAVEAYVEKWLQTRSSEMGHALEKQDLASKGPGKALVHHSHRDYLAKQRITHVSNGGLDPTLPSRLRQPKDPAKAAMLVARPEAPDSFVGLIDQDKIDSINDVASGAVLRPCRARLLAAAHGAPPALANPRVAAIANAGALALCDGAPGAGRARGRGRAHVTPPRAGRPVVHGPPGGSVYQVHLNRCRHAAALASAAPLTEPEQRALEVAARDEYANLNALERQAMAGLYQARVDARRSGVAVIPPPPQHGNARVYKPNLRVGSPSHVIRPEKFCEAPARAHALPSWD